MRTTLAPPLGEHNYLLHTYALRMQPIERVTTVAASAGVSTDKIEDGIDSGWDAAEDVHANLLASARVPAKAPSRRRFILTRL